MDRTEYNNRLSQIYNELDYSNCESYLKEIDYLSAYKPISARWFLVQSKAFMLCKRTEKGCLIQETGISFFDSRSEVIDMENNYILCAESDVDLLNKDRHLLLKKYFCNEIGFALDDSEESVIQLLEYNSEYLFNLLWNETMPSLLLHKQMENAYIRQELYLYHLYFGLICLKGLMGQSYLQDWVWKLPNIGYITEYCLKEQNKTFLVIQSDDEKLDSSMTAAYLLKKLGYSVYYIAKSIDVEIENDVNIVDTVATSLNAMEDSDYGRVIYPVRLIHKNGEVQNNRPYILKEMYQSGMIAGHALVYGTGRLLDEFMRDSLVSTAFQRLTPRMAPFLEHTINVGWYGDYCSYVGDIYQMDIRTCIEADAKCKFSIIIPARNSAYTLQYTLQTCLNQSYSGEYEIIVSDNSTTNSDVKDLCDSINDNRIRYIQTPRNLHLPKSFEYAYLHAKGEYILALGSDDGLLSCALEILEEVTEKYPDEEIIQWERGFYAWPGFNGGQQNKLVIPKTYPKGEYVLFFRDRADYIASVLAKPENMYSLPMLYINSCFKRSYFKTLLEKTGRLWDGVCQDIYMGMTTAAIKNRILNIAYPLSIAGMSEGSVGTQANRPKSASEFQEEQKVNQLDANAGAYCQTPCEYLIPDTGTDTWSLYTSFLRLISLGVLPQEYLTQLIDWKQVFTNLASELDIRDISFDRKLQEMKYAARYQGENFMSWFEETIYDPLMSILVADDDLEGRIQGNSGRSYEVGENEQGGYVLDASEHHVSDIYGATQLFESFL